MLRRLALFNSRAKLKASNIKETKRFFSSTMTMKTARTKQPVAGQENLPDLSIPHMLISPHGKMLQFECKIQVMAEYHTSARALHAAYPLQMTLPQAYDAIEKHWNDPAETWAATKLARYDAERQLGPVVADVHKPSTFWMQYLRAQTLHSDNDPKHRKWWSFDQGLGQRLYDQTTHEYSAWTSLWEVVPTDMKIDTSPWILTASASLAQLWAANLGSRLDRVALYPYVKRRSLQSMRYYYQPNATQWNHKSLTDASEATMFCNDRITERPFLYGFSPVSWEPIPFGHGLWFRSRTDWEELKTYFPPPIIWTKGNKLDELIRVRDY